ncbi:hypothetical protein AB0L53_25195 [Nonomuraea sp. NPDC052129]|uniref:alpha/beta fold hydrolase n=1 Tax=Nonomuraea sp. NPDC052129 TaxID=3154651 RepID=UPI00342B8429
MRQAGLRARPTAAILAGFVKEVGAEDTVIVGWSLGGHIAIEAAPGLPGAAGFVVFGTPPVGSVERLGRACLPNPAVHIGFTAEVGAGGSGGRA